MYQTLHYALSLLVHSWFIASFAFIQFSQSHCNANNRYHFEEYDIYEMHFHVLDITIIRPLKYNTTDIYIHEYIYNTHIYMGL